MRMKSQKPWMTRYARENRYVLTKAELVLWRELNDEQLGVRFRRQDPIGPYIADFSCRPHRLDIEADGDAHDNPLRDQVRDKWFRDHGWTVLRFDNDDIFLELDRTIDVILRALANP